MHMHTHVSFVLSALSPMYHSAPCSLASPHLSTYTAPFTSPWASVTLNTLMAFSPYLSQAFYSI